MIITKAAFFLAIPDCRQYLPPSVDLPDTAESLRSVHWDLLALDRRGCRALLSQRTVCSCGTLLLPGDTAASITQLVKARQVIGAGLSARNSITFSSLQAENALVCIQRTLRRTDGSAVEPQELLRSPLPFTAEEQLLLFGLQLLL